MLVSVHRLQRIPTLKNTMRGSLGISRGLPWVFLPTLCSRQLIFLMVRAQLVPVVEDQTSHLELTREIAQRFNCLYRPVFPLPHMLFGEVPLLPGIDG